MIPVGDMTQNAQSALIDGVYDSVCRHSRDRRLPYSCMVI